MRRSRTPNEALSRPIEKWSEKDVRDWLVTEVKVHETIAGTFVEEEVTGDSLVAFTKTDILDLGIKHGPAIKIMSHLQSLKDGSRRETFPTYVETWTKEQVHQWLLQHVNVYNKYTTRLQEEDVSGDCLVCFKKLDFLDLDVKSGPAVKILKSLRELNQNSEPTLRPVPETSSEQTKAPNVGQPEESPATTVASSQPELCNTTEPQTVTRVENKPGKDQLQFMNTSEDAQIHPLKPQNPGARRKETKTAPVLPGKPNMTVVIQETLENLSKGDLKKFHFHLKQFTRSHSKPIPQSKLESRDTMDTAKLMTDRYVGHEAYHITLEILRDIHQNELARQLENSMGKTQGHPEQRLAKEVVGREANQGEKLKNLLTCGGNSLDNYDKFVVVVNKSSPEQVQYLEFLKKLKLFCVLDFDPNSNIQGRLCHLYRGLRWANLHTPLQYQGQIDLVIKNLNLFKQTSWVFCNGRHDLESDSDRELDYRNWLRKSCKDIEHMVSFICNPEVLLHGRSLIIFLLLSPVESEKDPVYDTYRAFLKHIEEEMIVHICESQSTYEKWREIIQEKCDFDIDLLSINELSLSKVNGTIMGLGPFSKSSERLLPSSDSSAVVLKQRDEDLLNALDILCLNQCENAYEENSPEFNEKRKKVEVEFYRGGKVKWWNFYFCEKDKQKPFIKRDKYENVKKMIKNQLKGPKDMCALLNLFHKPGCGGTTLAMHVMWDLRREIRCAVLNDNNLSMAEVADQVIQLSMLESEKPCPVLLLVDDSKETENPLKLLKCVLQFAETHSNINVDKERSCKVIILNCVRSQYPRELYKPYKPDNQFMTAELTPEEKDEFEKKLEELKETHEKPENFYSFMIMKKNFDPEYTEKLAHDTLDNFDRSSKKAQLFAFLALLNTYVSESEVSRSLCEDFLGMKKVLWQEQSVLDRMEPYSDLLIINKDENWGGYEGIRILHHSIASACLKDLERSHSFKVSDITLEILHCDLFFSKFVVKNRFMDSLQQMLIVRQQKKDGIGREPFSQLVEKIHSDEGRQTVQQIFEKASTRFEKSLSIPQALARYLYIKEQDFPEALKWAEKAKNIRANPFTFDTIGQIHKSNLKSNNQREKQETSSNPDDLNTNIKLARYAITAFRKAQELANTEDEPEEEVVDDESEDYPRNSYNVKGYTGVLEIAFLVFEILSRLPFFDQMDPLKKVYFQKFLQKSIPITSVFKDDTEENHRYEEIIKEQEHFLQNLKIEVKETFDILDCFFTYTKASISEFQAKNFSIACGLYKDYISLFCSTPEEKSKEQHSNPNLNVNMDIEKKRLFLEKNQADTFAGVLQRLDKPAEEIEGITECYAFLQQQQQNMKQKNQKTKDRINYILSNVVLYLLKPNSKHVKSNSHLCDLLLTTLQEVGLGYPFPDPYYLALLLFWPSNTEDQSEIGTYVKAIRHASHRRLTSLFRNRTIAYLYLGKEKGLKRLISKSKLNETFKKMSREDLAQKWRNGHIFKEKAIINCLQRVKGTIEQGEVFASYGKLKIPVHPAFRPVSGGFSTEKVSFYIGFAINGPLAYDIQFEN